MSPLHQQRLLEQCLQHCEDVLLDDDWYDDAKVMRTVRQFLSTEQFSYLPRDSREELVEAVLGSLNPGFIGFF